MGRPSRAGGKTFSQKKNNVGAFKETEFFYYKQKGYWKCNCKMYLADKKSGFFNKV
jgi:hypothetical protein